MNICLFSTDEICNPLPLKDERAEHILKILHKKEGDSFTAGIIGGVSGIASISKISDAIYFDFKPTGNGKPLNPLKMIVGFPRPIQLKRLLRDIAALGVCEVHLTGTELGEKSYMKSNLVEKGSAYKMLLDGTVQAGSTNVPKLFLHQTLKECLESCDCGNKTSCEDLSEDLCETSCENSRENCSKKIFRFALDNVNPACSLNGVLKSEKISELSEKSAEKLECFAAIGSERGWTENERRLLESFGYTRCSMGSRIMRTETAATVSASIILNEMGFLD